MNCYLILSFTPRPCFSADLLWIVSVHSVRICCEVRTWNIGCAHLDRYRYIAWTQCCPHTASMAKAPQDGQPKLIRAAIIENAIQTWVHASLRCILYVRTDVAEALRKSWQYFSYLHLKSESPNIAYPSFRASPTLWPTFTETAPTAAASSSKDAGCIRVRIRSENRMVSNSNNRRAVRWEDACQDFRV